MRRLPRLCHFTESEGGWSRAPSKHKSTEFGTRSGPEGSRIRIDSLAERGVLDVARLYESPFSDLAPLGPEGLFGEGKVTDLVDILHRLRASAEAA